MSRPAPRPARPSRSSSGRSTSCASGPRPGWTSCTAPGVADARLYGEDPGDGVGGDGAFFLLLDEPEVYGLPPDPVVTTRDLPAMWRRVGRGGRRADGRRGRRSFAAERLGRARVSEFRGHPAGPRGAPPGHPASAGGDRHRAVPGAGGRRGEQPMVPPGRVHLLLRQADHQLARSGTSPDIPGYLFLGGLAGAVVAARRGRPATGRPGAGPRGQGRRTRRGQPVPGRAGARPGPARPGSSTCCACSR